MKVTDLRRKLAAALVAGGLFVPVAASGAELNVNLISNPGFEELDPGDSHILGWGAGSKLGFTYASGNYDNGGPLAGGGARYFTSNGSPGDVTGPGQVSQLISVSGGATGALIATGGAAFRLGGFFTGYLANGDFGSLQVDFLGSGGATLSSGLVSDANPSTWTQHFTGGEVPVGTESVRVSVFGTALSGGPDGYIDNVDFQITDEVLLPTLDLRINRADGSIVLSNRTGSAVPISGYQLSSAFGALDPAAWVSIADNYDSLSGGGVDGAHEWSELTQPGAHGDLSEGELEAGVGGSLTHTQSITLGAAGAWIRTPTEDLVFDYVSGGEVVRGVVTFDGADAYLPGDLNTDGVVNAADWTILRSNQHADLSGLSLAEAYRAGDLNADQQNNYSDFSAFKSAFEAANGVGSFAAVLGAPGAVPEPGSLVLLLGAGVGAASAYRRGAVRS